MLVGAAIGAGEDGVIRAEALADAGVDVVVVDTAHGHSEGVLKAVSRIREMSNDLQIIAGNIATKEGAEALIKAGADAENWHRSGVDMHHPHGGWRWRAAINRDYGCVSRVPKAGVPCIADGGIKYSGDLAKAIAAGADVAMIGSMLAGTDETPGEVFYQGQSYKAYRGMGSLGAMATGSADRYFQAEVSQPLKLVPEGIEGQVPYKGPASAVIHQMLGG